MSAEDGLGLDDLLVVVGRVDAEEELVGRVDGLTKVVVVGAGDEPLGVGVVSVRVSTVWPRAGRR